MYNHVSNLPALANNSSASVIKPKLAKLACSVSVMWRSIDRLHCLIGTYSVLKYLALEPHSPPTSVEHSVWSHISEQWTSADYSSRYQNFISNENRANKEIDDSGRRSH